MEKREDETILKIDAEPSITQVESLALYRHSPEPP
jgi:hypothetical protein